MHSYGTFDASPQVETEEDEAAGGNHSIKRSFSDSHIESLKEAGTHGCLVVA